MTSRHHAFTQLLNGVSQQDLLLKQLLMSGYLLYITDRIFEVNLWY